ncbi:hypothetical protein H5410_014174 [Solanum commersonii]|uniref:Uncharacterized protein n=1 Tax=Solanum commersonii TaxID=4109 RepID=A0A9J5ZQ87_SOLCO|nr:hypothetical protein H5410_014174 [Solanum commersonii]
MSSKLKGGVMVRPMLLYEIEWLVKNAHIWMCGTLKEMIRNEIIWGKVEVTLVLTDKMREPSWLRWPYEHRRCEDTLIRRYERLVIAGLRRGRSRTKKN